MDDGLNLQRDDVGRVVRIMVDGEVHELAPAEAEEVGERIIRMGRELQTTQTTLAEGSDEDQHTLDDAAEPETESLAEMRDRLHADAGASPEPGDVINENDPMKW